MRLKFSAQGNRPPKGSIKSKKHGVLIPDPIEDDLDRVPITVADP